MDDTPAYGSRGRGFESLPARSKPQNSGGFRSGWSHVGHGRADHQADEDQRDRVVDSPQPRWVVEAGNPGLFFGGGSCDRSPAVTLATGEGSELPAGPSHPPILAACSCDGGGLVEHCLGIEWRRAWLEDKQNPALGASPMEELLLVALRGDADLAHEPQGVRVGPVLDDAAVCDAVESVPVNATSPPLRGPGTPVGCCGSRGRGWWGRTWS